MLLLRLLPSREAGRNDRKPLDIEIEAQCSSSWYARKDPDNAIERHLSRKIAGPASFPQERKLSTGNKDNMTNQRRTFND